LAGASTALRVLGRLETAMPAADGADDGAEPTDGEEEDDDERPLYMARRNRQEKGEEYNGDSWSLLPPAQ